MMKIIVLQIKKNHLCFCKTKKNKKYKKKIQLNIPKYFKNEIKYIEYQDESKNTWKWSLNRFNENKISASYRCQDTNCNARGTIKFNINENNNEIINLNNLVLIQKKNILWRGTTIII